MTQQANRHDDHIEPDSLVTGWLEMVSHGQIGLAHLAGLDSTSAAIAGVLFERIGRARSHGWQIQWTRHESGVLATASRKDAVLEEQARTTLGALIGLLSEIEDNAPASDTGA